MKQGNKGLQNVPNKGLQPLVREKICFALGMLLKICNFRGYNKKESFVVYITLKRTILHFCIAFV